MEQPNLDYIHTLSGGDKTFEDKLISIIKSEFSVEKNIFLKSIENKNYKDAAGIVHKLKHKIIILGLEKGFGIASELENNLRKENLKGVKDFNKVLDLISSYLNLI